MIETTWLCAANNLDQYHAETKAWRDKMVIRKDISLSNLVLIHHPDKQGKLQSQWYGPFIIASMIKPRTNRLMNDEGVETEHTQNTDNMHRFYPQSSIVFAFFFLLLFYLNLHVILTLLVATSRGLALSFLTGETIANGCEVFFNEAILCKALLLSSKLSPKNVVSAKC